MADVDSALSLVLRPPVSAVVVGLTVVVMLVVLVGVLFVKVAALLVVPMHPMTIPVKTGHPNPFVADIPVNWPLVEGLVADADRNSDRAPGRLHPHSRRDNRGRQPCD